MSLHYLGKYFKVPLFSMNRENVKVSVWHIFRSSRNFNIKIKSFWTREMRDVLTVNNTGHPSKGPHFDSRTQMVAHICLQPQLQEIQYPLQGSVTTKHSCDV